MADYISRQAALEAVNDCGICIQRIVDIPTADAAEVVRCRDCIWRYHDVIDGEEMDWCGVWANQTQEDVFCSYGKGRNNG